MIEDYKITSYQKGIAGLSDTPNSDGLTAAALKEMFDYRSDNEIRDSINGIIDSLTGESGAENITAKDKDGNDSTVQAVLDDLFTKPVVVTTTTTFQEITNLYNDGNKLILLVHSGRVYRLVRLALTDATFAALASVTVGDEHTLCARTYWLSVNSSNVWDNWDNTLQNILTFDTTPTDGSTNPVTSDGIYDAIDAKSAFIATYGATTNNEIKAAVQAGRPVILKRNSKLYTLVTSGSNSAIFAYVNRLGQRAEVDVLVVSGSTWTDNGSITLITTNDYDTLDTAIGTKQDTLTFDNTPTEDSTNPVTSGGVYDAIAAKQDTLTFDNTPTEDSTNPVTSGGVYNAIAAETARATAAEALKADLASPALTGNPTAPTQTEGDNSTKIATTAYADRAVATETARATAAESAVALNAAPAILNTASGAVCSFPDGSASPMRSVIAQIVASQAGSGTPYPAGGGVNKLQTTLASQVNRGTTITVNADGSVTISGTPTSAVTVVFSTTNSASGAARTISCSGFPAGTRVYCKRTNDGTSAVDYPTVASASTTTFAVGSGYSVTTFTLEINTSYDGTATTLKLQLEDGSTATPWAPYENIRPISGYTGADVTRAGRNLFNKDNAASIITGYIADNGVITAGAGNATVFIPCVPNTAYTVSKTAGTRFRVGYTKETPAASVACYGVVTNNTATEITITTGADAKYLVARVWYTGDTAAETDMLGSVQIELGSTATAYKPYVGEVFSVSWADEAGTVYKGSADAVNGDGQDESIFLVFDGTENWSYQASSQIFTYGFSPASNGRWQDIMCSHFPPKNIYSGTTNEGVGCWSGQFYLRWPSMFTDVATLKAWLAAQYAAGTPLQAMLVRATASPFTFAGQTINSLYGDNTIWNDTNGDTSAEYRADTKLYIDAKIAAL